MLPISFVVPRAGTWIETLSSSSKRYIALVVPRAGTWIETDHLYGIGILAGLSFPVRERGLKRLHGTYAELWDCVVPRAGTWIETHHFVMDSTD